MSYEDPSPHEAAVYILNGNLGAKGLLKGKDPDSEYILELLRELRELKGAFEAQGKLFLWEEQIETLTDVTAYQGRPQEQEEVGQRRHSLLENIKKHPIVSSVFFGAALIGVVGSYGVLWETLTNAWQAHFYPSSYEGELCQYQPPEGCGDPERFSKVVNSAEWFSTIELDVVFVSPPSIRVGQFCMPKLYEPVVGAGWEPISLDTNPENGCDNEILISRSAIKSLAVANGMTYQEIKGTFQKIPVGIGPLKWTALIED